MKNKDNDKTAAANAGFGPALTEVASSPHLVESGRTTRRMMIDVLLALVPVAGAAVYFFRWPAVRQMAICLAACLAAEALFALMRRHRPPLADGSAAVTALILALSLPVTAPWYTAVIGSVAAIGVGKALFGGLGMNLFNPAMVGRAFVMISFAGALGAAGYQDPGSSIDVMTQATPLTAFQQSGVSAGLADLFLGRTNGSLGETSALACLIGGLFLCIRRSAAWRIPAAMLAAAGIIALLDTGLGVEGWTAAHHLFSGAMLFGAFFIATDPVSSPLTPLGQIIYGAGIGALVMVIRLFSGYPEGVMFAVLLMNALTPLINRWTIPTPFGGQ
ncbi:MAG TPA: RnfABCDGE type electron transport complex subunit D [Desulfobacteraceae bacterium]|nr:RnfABCDGE type electron transport complex subunit D [Deltaproteobacteria bacterium]MBW2356468.1 RnfABCDGE type electron transport complex subunit D [Deltaproteobacteria bacterium]HDI59241.1 RnfABCDGE type electron transport complex subunit D [Desulfobacteraceae bacterium]